MKNKVEISKIAYELYKQNWLNTHTTPKVRLDTLRSYLLEAKACADEGETIEPFEEWIEECGYGEGSLYVCYEEFCDAEYLEKDYMKELLKNDGLIALYLEDIEE